jgi:hypothetical protein
MTAQEQVLQALLRVEGLATNCRSAPWMSWLWVGT